MYLRSWLQAGIKLMDGQDSPVHRWRVSSSQEPLRGSKSKTEEDTIPVLTEADNIEEVDVVFITEDEEWSESDMYSA